MRTLILTVVLCWGPHAALATDGAELFAAHCAGCHGPDGKGDTPAAKAMNIAPIGGTPAEAVAKSMTAVTAHKALQGKLGAAELEAIASFLSGLKGE